MAVTIKWKDNSLLEKGHRIYKSSTYFTPDNLPTPLADLGPDIEEYQDTASNAGENWYIVSAYILGYEVFSEPFIPGLITVFTHDIFGDGSAVATYNFDGDATDLGGSYNGSLNGATYDNGVIAQSIYTDGVGSYVDIYNITSKRYSLSMWIAVYDELFHGLFGFDSLIGGESSNSIPRVIGLDTGNSGLESSFNNYQFNSGSFPTDGTFFHLVVSVYDNAGTFYINGVQQTMTESSGQRYQEYSGGGFLGRMSTAYDIYKKAKFDQVRIFNRILTQQEVDLLYQEGA